ncbi:MAG: thioredoxin [Bacteroidales bacterium]|nr:thioredoxin [Bacteroidales bacterium]
MIQFTDENFEELVLNSGKPAVIDFGATWCGPCQVIKPYIHEMSESYEGKAVIGYVDIDTVSDLTMKYGIRSVPTVVFIKDGKVADKVVGAVSKAELISKLEAIL